MMRLPGTIKVQLDAWNFLSKLNSIEKINYLINLEMRFCFIAQADLELNIFLPQSPKFWDYRYAYWAWFEAPPPPPGITGMHY